MVSGLVISIGGLQDSLRKVSISALLEYLQVVESEELNRRSSREYMLSTDILWVLQQYKRCDRVIVPTLKVYELLLRNVNFEFLCALVCFAIFFCSYQNFKICGEIIINSITFFRFSAHHHSYLSIGFPFFLCHMLYTYPHILLSFLFLFITFNFDDFCCVFQTIESLFSKKIFLNMEVSFDISLFLPSPVY